MDTGDGGGGGGGGGLFCKTNYYQVVEAVTILEAPPMVVVGIVGYVR